MGIVNFIIVLFYNVLWLALYGREDYVSLYTARGIPVWLSVSIWAYTMWGVSNLIFFLI